MCKYQRLSSAGWYGFEGCAQGPNVGCSSRNQFGATLAAAGSGGAVFSRALWGPLLLKVAQCGCNFLWHNLALRTGSQRVIPVEDASQIAL